MSATIVERSSLNPIPAKGAAAETAQRRRLTHDRILTSSDRPERTTPMPDSNSTVGGHALTEADIGKMFSVPWSPNAHRLEFVRPRHCSLHGEFIGMEAGFLKRRNSEKRPWGNCICVVPVDDPRIQPIPDSGASS